MESSGISENDNPSIDIAAAAATQPEGVSGHVIGKKAPREMDEDAGEVGGDSSTAASSGPSRGKDGGVDVAEGGSAERRNSSTGEWNEVDVTAALSSSTRGDTSGEGSPASSGSSKGGAAERRRQRYQQKQELLELEVKRAESTSPSVAWDISGSIQRLQQQQKLISSAGDSSPVRHRDDGSVGGSGSGSGSVGSAARRRRKERYLMQQQQLQLAQQSQKLALLSLSQSTTPTASDNNRTGTPPPPLLFPLAEPMQNSPSMIHHPRSPVPCRMVLLPTADQDESGPGKRNANESSAAERSISPTVLTGQESALPTSSSASSRLPSEAAVADKAEKKSTDVPLLTEANESKDSKENQSGTLSLDALPPPPSSALTLQTDDSKQGEAKEEGKDGVSEQRRSATPPLAPSSSSMSVHPSSGPTATPSTPPTPPNLPPLTPTSSTTPTRPYQYHRTAHQTTTGGVGTTTTSSNGSTGGGTSFLNVPSAPWPLSTKIPIIPIPLSPHSPRRCSASTIASTISATSSSAASSPRYGTTTAGTAGGSNNNKSPKSMSYSLAIMETLRLQYEERQKEERLWCDKDILLPTSDDEDDDDDDDDDAENNNDKGYKSTYDTSDGRGEEKRNKKERRASGQKQEVEDSLGKKNGDNDDDKGSSKDDTNNNERIKMRARQTNSSVTENVSGGGGGGYNTANDNNDPGTATATATATATEKETKVEDDKSATNSKDRVKERRRRRKRDKVAVFNANTTEGGSIVRSLIKQDCDVVAIVRVITSKNARALLKLPGVSVKVADSRHDADTIAKAIAGCDRVFLVTMWWEKFDNYLEERQAFTIFDACHKADVHNVVFSTFEDLRQLRVQGEKSQIRPKADGSIQPKFEGMKDAVEHAKTLGIRVTHMITSYLDQEKSRKALCVIKGGEKILIQSHMDD